MIMNVDYLSRMYNNLSKTYITIANDLSLADRAARPGAYNATILHNILSPGKYSLKPTDARQGAAPITNI